MEDINKSRLSITERLALAAYRLNCFEWDELAGDKPEGFDAMTCEEKQRFVFPKYAQIEELLGEVYLNRCFWIFDGNTEEEWLAWRRLRITQEKEYERHEDTQRAEEDGEKLQTKIALLLAFCACICFGLLLLLVFKTLHGGFTA